MPIVFQKILPLAPLAFGTRQNLYQKEMCCLLLKDLTYFFLRDEVVHLDELVASRASQIVGNGLTIDIGSDCSWLEQ